jgi:hypothetical protein
MHVIYHQWHIAETDPNHKTLSSPQILFAQKGIDVFYSFSIHPGLRLGSPLNQIGYNVVEKFPGQIPALHFRKDPRGNTPKSFIAEPAEG